MERREGRQSGETPFGLMIDSLMGCTAGQGVFIFVDISFGGIVLRRHHFGDNLSSRDCRSAGVQ